MRYGLKEIREVVDIVSEKYPEYSDQLISAYNLMLQKNQDYTGDYPNGTFFDNFYISAFLMLQTPEISMSVLITTKIARLISLLRWRITLRILLHNDELTDDELALLNSLDKEINMPTEIKFESIEDTIFDGINYLMILDAFLRAESNLWDTGQELETKSTIFLVKPHVVDSYLFDNLERMGIIITPIVRSFIRIMFSLYRLDDLKEENVLPVCDNIEKAIGDWLHLYEQIRQTN